MANNSRIEQIKTFLNQSPKDAFLLYALATEYIALGKDTEAQEIFEDLINNQGDYFATYYHLAKLYERQGREDLAISTYENGMDVCKRLDEQHAYRELRAAYDELLFD